MAEMGDLISRQAVDELVWRFLKKGTDENIAFYEHFLELPSVKDWIPVSSGVLPDIGQRVLVTIESYDEGRTVRETIYDKHGFLCGNGVAWMPKPEPYKGD